MRVLVAGLGIQGAACLFALAERGVDVVGCDLHAPPHLHGSSHGRTRILRFAYFEHPLYVPLVRAALDVWQRLERDTGRSLFRATGALNLGPAEGGLIAGVRASVTAHDVPHQDLSAAEIRRRFGLAMPEGTVGIFEPTAGVLATDSCHEGLLGGAVRAGATIEVEAPITSFEERAGEVTVRRGADETAVDALVLATGPWLATTPAGSALGLWIERQVTYWFAVEPGPAFLQELADGRMVYGVPGPGRRLKAALHHSGRRVAGPEAAEPPGPADQAHVTTLVHALLPSAGTAEHAEVCLYTNTADGHFIIDRLPGHERVFVVSACSGHGFKFAPAVGARLADLILDGSPAGPFAAGRAALTPAG